MKRDDEDFFLSSVVYSKYWDKIKLVGYQMKLRPDHLEQIKDDIGLDTSLLELVAPKNPVKAVFNDDDFGYSEGMHVPRNKLLIGYMYCKVVN